MGGIARAASLDEKVVRDYIEKNDCFITSSISPAGKRLYAVKRAGTKSESLRERIRKATGSG